MTTYPFATQISQLTKRQPAFANMLKAQFNDGYAMRSPDGLASLIDGFVLVHDGFGQTDRDAFWTFFDAHGTWDSWTLTVPGDSIPTKWVFVLMPTETFGPGLIYSISAQIEQVFE